MAFEFLGSNSPRYVGADGTPQAQPSQSLLSFLSGLFGGTGTPAYAGAGHPAAASRGSWLRLFASSPRYASPPVDSVSTASVGDAEPHASGDVIIATPDAEACAEAVLQRLQNAVFDND